MTAVQRLPSNFAWQGSVLLVAAVAGALGGVNPLYGLAAAFGLAFLGVVLSDLTVGLCLFTIVSFLDVLSGSQSLSFSKLAGLLLVVSWAGAAIGRRGREKGFIAAHPIAVYIMGLFLVWAALSYVWAESHSQVISDWYRYALNLALLPIVYAAVRKRRHVLWVLAAFIAGAAVSALYGIASPGGGAAEADLVRATGTIGDANELAAVLVAGAVLAATLAIAIRRRPAVRLAAAAAAALCVYGIFLTLSRGGLIAFGAALAAAILCGGRWRPYLAVGAVLLALLGVGYFELIASPDARARVTTVGGGSGRSDIWTVGWRMVEAHPLNGVGLGNFQTSSIHYLLQPGLVTRSDLIIDTPELAHNMYLQVLSELGVVGLILFLSLLAFALGSALKAAREFGREKDVQMELVARGVLVALVGVLAADFFISDEFSKQLWLLIAMCPALLAVARRGRQAASAADPSAPRPANGRGVRGPLVPQRA